MLNGRYRGQTIGSGTHVWKFDEDMKTGRMSQEECEYAESCMSRSIGHCMTMGTASTMACMVESLGLTLSGAAAIPAASGERCSTRSAGVRRRWSAIARLPAGRRARCKGRG